MNKSIKKDKTQIHQLKEKNQNLKIKNLDQDQDHYLEVQVFKENCQEYHRI